MNVDDVGFRHDKMCHVQFRLMLNLSEVSKIDFIYWHTLLFNLLRNLSGNTCCLGITSHACEMLHLVLLRNRRQIQALLNTYK